MIALEFYLLLRQLEPTVNISPTIVLGKHFTNQPEQEQLLPGYENKQTWLRVRFYRRMKIKKAVSLIYRNFFFFFFFDKMDLRFFLFSYDDM